MEERLLPICLWGAMLTVFSATATAIQHICMAKALIREHDLRVMHMGPDSDRHARRLKVLLLEITMSSSFFFLFCQRIIPEGTKSLTFGQEEVMENLSVLFGIALSADDDPSARTMACHALCACMELSRPLLCGFSTAISESPTNHYYSG